MSSVAVIIAAYNAEATLARAIGSALAQPEASEICVIDDASSDATLRIAEDIARAEARVSVLHNPSNLGPAASRNRAIEATSAAWLTVLDADDYLLAGRLGRLLRRADGADFAADALIRTHEGGSPHAPPPTAAYAPLGFTAFVLGNLGRSRGPLDLGFLKPVMSRDFLERHALRYRQEMRLGEDYELYARALALGARFVVGGAEGYVSVERPGSLSKAHSEADLKRLRDCDDGIAASCALTRSEKRALRRHWHSVDCRLQWRRLISAVKTRDVNAAFTTFHTPQTALYLAARLGEQAVERSARRFGFMRSRGFAPS